MQILNNSSRELTHQSRNFNKKPKEWKLVINIVYTQYEVLQNAAQETNFRLS